MLADFCLRLAAGLMLCLLVLSPVATARPAPGQRPLANPVYFRTQFLIVLALACGSWLWLYTQGANFLPMLALLGVSGLLAFLGSVSWSLDRSPGGVTLIVLSALLLTAAVVVHELTGPGLMTVLRLAGALSSAMLLGSALSAMLMGHNYLISPTMSLTPLYRLLAATAIALALRMLVEGVVLASWIQVREGTPWSGDVALWLPVRWLVGFVAPAVLLWMAYQSAKIRSTQSATGILYVVVIFCFLGELTGLLLTQLGVTA